jgi:hypothetical protein
MRLILIKYLTLLSMLGLLIACGITEQDAERVSRIGENTQEEYEYVPVDVSLIERQEQSSEDLGEGFNLTFNLLADATAGEFLPKCNDAISGSAGSKAFSGNDFSPTNEQTSTTTYVPVGLYCHIEIKKFTLNGVVYTYQSNVSGGNWKTSSTTYEYEDSSGNTVNLKVTANSLFDNNGDYVEVESSGSYSISASLVFVQDESENVLRAAQTSIAISGTPVPEFTASATSGFVYDSGAWNFQIDLTLVCKDADNRWTADNSTAASSTCKENASGSAVALSDLKYNKAHTSQIGTKDESTLSGLGLSYTTVADSDVSLSDKGLQFTLDQSISDASFPSSSDAYRYLILKRGSDAYSVFEFVLKKTN